MNSDDIPISPPSSDEDFAQSEDDSPCAQSYPIYASNWTTSTTIEHCPVTINLTLFQNQPPVTLTFNFKIRRQQVIITNQSECLTTFFEDEEMHLPLGRSNRRKSKHAQLFPKNYSQYAVQFSRILRATHQKHRKRRLRKKLLDAEILALQNRRRQHGATANHYRNNNVLIVIEPARNVNYNAAHVIFRALKRVRANYLAAHACVVYPWILNWTTYPPPGPLSTRVDVYNSHLISSIRRANSLPSCIQDLFSLLGVGVQHADDACLFHQPVHVISQLVLDAYILNRQPGNVDAEILKSTSMLGISFCALLNVSTENLLEFKGTLLRFWQQYCVLTIELARYQNNKDKQPVDEADTWTTHIPWANKHKTTGNNFMDYSLITDIFPVFSQMHPEQYNVEAADAAADQDILSRQVQHLEILRYCSFELQINPKFQLFYADSRETRFCPELAYNVTGCKISGSFNLKLLIRRTFDEETQNWIPGVVGGLNGLISGLAQLHGEVIEHVPVLDLHVIQNQCAVNDYEPAKLLEYYFSVLNRFPQITHATGTRLVRLAQYLASDEGVISADLLCNLVDVVYEITTDIWNLCFSSRANWYSEKSKACESKTFFNLHLASQTSLYQLWRWANISNSDKSFLDAVKRSYYMYMTDDINGTQISLQPLPAVFHIAKMSIIRAKLAIYDYAMAYAILTLTLRVLGFEAFSYLDLKQYLAHVFDALSTTDHQPVPTASTLCEAMLTYWQRNPRVFFMFNSTTLFYSDYEDEDTEKEEEEEAAELNVAKQILVDGIYSLVEQPEQDPGYRRGLSKIQYYLYDPSDKGISEHCIETLNEFGDTFEQYAVVIDTFLERIWTVVTVTYSHIFDLMASPSTANPEAIAVILKS